ncbi:MAG: hypothetical protein GY832_38955, partial [Chloroflexi bacterium]|nr:hypothetical protein [Chloroflexota bacterium]
DGRAYVPGGLGSGRTADHKLCRVYFPTRRAGVAGQYELLGEFIDDPTKPPISYQFELTQDTTPNLIMLREALVDAWHGGERLTTLRSGQSFDIQAHVVSEFFPVTSAQVRLSVMSRLPGAAANKDGFGYQLWKEITVDPTTNLANFTNLTVEEIPLPAGSNWGLLHLWIEIDPDNLIPETNDTGDNFLKIDNWIPFCNDSGDRSLDTLVGAHMGTEEFDGTGTLGEFSPNFLSTSVNLGYGSLFMRYNPGTNGTNPFIGWSHNQGGSVGGVMVRYIRPHHGNQPSELRIGVANGVNPANP